jgi:RNA polymerase sigma-70 factor (ECF subfamily)
LNEDFVQEAEAVAPESEHTGVARDVARAMVDLSDGERAAILQCYYNDLSHEEAAFVLRMPLGTVKTNILKAKEKMRAKLNDYAQDSRYGKGAAA